jgi:hypothetical protein
MKKRQRVSLPLQSGNQKAPDEAIPANQKNAHGKAAMRPAPS